MAAATVGHWLQTALSGQRITEETEL